MRFPQVAEVVPHESAIGGFRHRHTDSYFKRQQTGSSQRL
jgi:hypothetical protein